MTTKTDNQIWYTRGYKYQLSRAYTTYTAIRPKQNIKTKYITLTKEGFLTAAEGYAWDGPSGPTIDDDTNMRASVAHDMKYQLIRLKLISSAYRIVADKELKEDLEEDGMPWLRRQEWYWLLRLAGGNSFFPKVCKSNPRGSTVRIQIKRGKMLTPVQFSSEQFAQLLRVITDRSYTITGAADWQILVVVGTLFCALIGFMWRDLKSSVRDLRTDWHEDLIAYKAEVDTRINDLRIIIDNCKIDHRP